MSDFMRRALRLASQGLGDTTPNPSVGCVIVQGGTIVGEGRTEPNRGRHAEVVALAQAGERARGATAYVTLEPCSHTISSRGEPRVPCATHLINAGIARVVCAYEDPDSRVSGRGLALLREAGIAVEVSALEAQAITLYRPYSKHRTTGLPYVLHKAAMTADGKIASVTGHSRWVTGDSMRRYIHRLRHQSDVIIVGVGTVLADDPQLTTRLPRTHTRNPLRIVFDSHLRLPMDARLVGGNTQILTTDAAPEEKALSLRNRGAEVVRLPADSTGRVSVSDALRYLGTLGFYAALLESGGALAEAFWRAGMVDEVLYCIAPKIIGGKNAPTPVDGDGLSDTMSVAIALTPFRVRRFGNDVALSAYTIQEKA